MEALQNMENDFMCKLVLANRTTRAILINSHSYAREAYSDAATKMNLTHNLKHFGLFEFDEEHGMLCGFFVAMNRIRFHLKQRVRIVAY